MSNKERGRGKVAEILGRTPQIVVDDVVLTDLVNSSFLLVEMVIELQEEFDVRFQQVDMNEVATVGQLLNLVDSRMGENSPG